MDDLISRQAAIDAILKQTICATKRELVERCDANISDENGWLGGVCIALDTIEDLPSAQPEIIRCKDCNHWTTMVERPKHGTCDQWCTLNVTRRDEYCSRAERKKE